jgi:hypothetical protein
MGIFLVHPSPSFVITGNSLQGRDKMSHDSAGPIIPPSQIVETATGMANAFFSDSPADNSNRSGRYI